MVKKNQIPKIRFNTYSTPWLDYTLIDVIDVIERPFTMFDNENYQCVTVKRRNEGIVSRGIFKGSSILVKSQFKLKAGDYLISKRQVVHGANGIVPTELDDAIVSNEYLVFQESEKLNMEFLAIISKLPYMYEAFFLSSNGVHIEKLLFDFNDWLTRNICIPNKDEQRAIVNFFRSLDETITLKKQQHIQTQNLKKAMFEKMFPKKGVDVPEIRFKGFSKPWVEKKLGDCFTERTERSSVGELLSVTMNSGVVKASSLQRRDNSSDDKSNYKVVKVDDIAYNSMRMWQGASGHSQYDGIVSPAYTIVTPKENIHSPFFSYFFKKPETILTFEKNSQGLTSDTWNLKFPAFSKIKTVFPDTTEQIAIGSFFRNLDLLIVTQQEEIEKLQNVKNAFLNKMFV